MPGCRDFERGFEIMNDAAVFGFGNFGDSRFASSVEITSCVEDLSAAGGIEGGAVQDQLRGAGIFLTSRTSASKS